MPPIDQLPAAYLAATKRCGELENEVTDLKRELEWHRRRAFGVGKSEAFERTQLLLKLKEIEEREAKAQAPAQKISYERTVPAPEKRKTPAEPFAKLPIKETVVHEPVEVKANPEAYEQIGEERTFEVEIVAPQMFKREIVRPKYRLKADRSKPPVLAPAPARTVPGGYASAGLLAWVVIAKFLDHLPLARQERMLGRWGALIPRQTLCEWTRITAEWLEPIYKIMLKRLLAGDYLQVDETPVQCNDPDHPKGTSQGYLWVVGRPGDDVCFDWRMSRQHAELTSLIEGLKGVLQSDAYGAYAAYAAAHPEITWTGCWAHCRRRWVEAQAENPKATRVVLKLIGRLYRLERSWDESDEHAGRARDPEQRAQLRQSHFARSLKWLRALTLKLQGEVRPKSGLGEASHYQLAQWEPLTRHLSCGITRLDTNVLENAIRPSALGKRNWLFVGHPEAGQRTAILYSILISCQRHGKDPSAYLRDVLSRLPRMTNQDDLEALIPSRWQPAVAGV